MRKRRQLVVSLAAVSTLLLTACSPTGSSSGLTEAQCGALLETQAALMSLTSEFESVLLEDIDTRQRAIWDAGYINIAEFKDAMSEQSDYIGMVVAMEETPPEIASRLSAIQDAISTYNYHWVDDDGNELANAAVAVREGQYTLLEVCESYLDN